MRDYALWRHKLNTFLTRAPEKIGAAAARVLARNHGTRYYDWRLRDGRFDYVDHPVNLPQEKALEGKYVIQTEEPDFSALDAVAIYKELSEAERAFRGLKDVIYDTSLPGFVLRLAPSGE